jgi:transcriptional regulator with XRE-family HTH domain/Zn-dependent peptidase ImmA (M78 family)
MSRATDTSAQWDEPTYQRLAHAHGEGFDLVVKFENGDDICIDARRLVDLDRPPEWRQLVVGDLEIEIPTDAGAIAISWLDLRALTDTEFAGHLAQQADEQAQQVGHRLRLLRERRGLRSGELAKRAGISAQSLSRIERGRHDVVFSTLQRLLAAMNYDLSDLSSVEYADVAPTQVRKALTASGLDKETIKRVLFGADRPGEVLARVRSVFNWSPTDITAPNGPPLLTAAAAGGRFKAQAVGHRAALTYVLYAHKVAMLADQVAKRPDYTPLPSDAITIREEILEAHGDLRFASIASYCWERGIIIVPMADQGQFHGVCWLLGGRPAVVLKQGLTYDSRWVFDLGHEICHVVRHLSPDSPAIIEFDEIGANEEDEEVEASQFAGVLLLGDPDALAKRVVDVAGGHGPNLKRAVVRVAQEADVDVGVLANYIAYRLDLTPGFDFPFWSVAANLQEGDRDAPQIARRMLKQRIDWDGLAEDDAWVLRGALLDGEDE